MSNYISVSEINKLFGTKLTKLSISGASIDTRTLKKGNIFFAFKGKIFDGHKFLDKAEKKGASIAIVERVSKKLKLQQIKVKNVHKALIDLAKIYRSNLNSKFVGITGSVGKTSTKDSISHLFRGNKYVFCNRKSFNNNIGLPLEILNMPRQTKYGFFELGMNHPSEISKLVKILKPHIAVILNIENVHLGNFKSLKEIALAKSEIFTTTNSVETLILNSDTNHYTYIQNLFKKSKVKYLANYSLNKKTQYNYKISQKNNKLLQVTIKSNQKQLSSYEIRNDQRNLISNSVCIACCLDILDLDQNIIKKFNKIPLTPGRGNHIKSSYKSYKLNIIDHSYNASPLSMRESINIYNSLKMANKLCILGDMNELGFKSKAFHKDILSHALSKRFKNYFFVGKQFHDLKFKQKNVNFYENIDELINDIDKVIIRNCAIFVKGSNSINLKKFIEFVSSKK